MKFVTASTLFIASLFCCITPVHAASQKNIKNKSKETAADLLRNEQLKLPEEKKFIIKKIIIEGNNIVKPALIKSRIPYKEGEIFQANLSDKAINNLYSFGSFRQIKIEVEQIDDTYINLFVVVDEKKILEDLIIKGNKSITQEKLYEKFNLKKLSSVDEETLRQLSIAIKKLYAEENRHFVKVYTKLNVNPKHPHKASATITIDEGPKSIIKYIHFKGNTRLNDRVIRSNIFTRENWLLSFTDGAGTYNKEAIEIDRHRIEYLYRDHGYLTAKVVKVDTKFSPNKRDISVTFYIKEGKQFSVRNIYIPGDELFSEETLLKEIVLEKGKPYAQSKMIKSMNKLRDLWGEKGYIYANVYPQVKPDETTNEVDITFHVEKGNKLYANRINITGNAVTKDKVIRRQLDIDEGDLITSKKLQRSKASVEYLSYFERDGVNWKIHRISDDLADIELHVKETQTGHFNLQFSLGSDQYSPKKSLRGMITFEKRNLMGNGYDVGGMVETYIEKINTHKLKKAEAHFFDPYFLDSDISSEFSIYKRVDEYSQWKNVDQTPIQKTVGMNTRFGFGLPWIDKRLQLILDLGIENIRNNSPKATEQYLNMFGPIVDRTFQQGTLKWLGIDLIKDTRNHQVYPNQGYKLTLSTKLAPTGINSDFCFFKTEAHGSCYTSIIGKDSLVLALQLKMGHVESLRKKNIPYKELFHMGGPSTVRGHIWGGIGPAWKNGSPLGAKNYVQFNTELIFPLIEDYSMKGHVFYDTGAGWHTPKKNIANQDFIQRNSFDLRHTVGFGINLVKPFPAKIDWGFKLDRKRNRGETPHEFHLTMNYAW